MDRACRVLADRTQFSVVSGPDTGKPLKEVNPRDLPAVHHSQAKCARGRYDVVTASSQPLCWPSSLSLHALASRGADISASERPGRSIDDARRDATGDPLGLAARPTRAS